MKITLKRLALGIASAGMLTVYGCGGGSNDPAAPGTTDVPITVIDGPIQNATVCLDKNSNGVCDSGEPSGKTDIAGKVNLTVDVADVGKYPVIAVVGTDAFDADRPGIAITVPFTMSAPADQVGVVSPLTTLVQQTIASTGASTAEAAAAVQAATGINVSLFQDFTKVAAPTDGSISAATVARMVVVTTQQQFTAIANTLGAPVVGRAAIMQADLDMAIQKKLLELLPALVAALSDPAVLAATTPASKEAALLAAASTLVTNSGLTTGSMATVVAINTQTSSTAPIASVPPSAGFNLDSLNFTNATNFFARVFTASLAQSTPDASNNTKYVERRQRSNTDNLAKWGAGIDPSRGADLHWNGSAWANCPINFENTSSVRDAQGNSSYNYCGNRQTGKTNRATFDIAGKTLASVITDVRAAGYTNLSIGDNTPSALTTALGSVTFPADSKLLYQTSTPLTNAISYYPGSDFYVYQTNANVAAGKTSATSTTEACAPITVSTARTSYASTTATLDGLIAVNKGTPCVYGTNTVTGTIGPLSSGTRNEWWGQSTLSLGTLGTASISSTPTTSYYTTNTLLNVGFGTGNVANYYSCQQRYNGGGARNCNLIGSGTYAIQTLGDAKTLSFSGLPAQTSPLTFTRVFVERGGLVYFGYQNRPGVSNTARLNTVGATALLNQLGVTPEDPAVPLALTAASYQGTWDAHDPANPSGNGITVFIGGNGSVMCREGSTPITCSLTITNPATGAFTLTDSIASGGVATSTVTGTLNFLTGGVSGTFTDTMPLLTGNVVGQRR